MSSSTEAPSRGGVDPVAWLKLVRFPLVFTAVADSLAGWRLAFSGSHAEGNTDYLSEGACWLPAVSSGLYLAGMALNDVADRKRDAELAPGRPIPSGRISPGAAVAVCVALLLGSAACMAWPGGAPRLQRMVLWGGVALAILAYDFFLKVSPTMGLVRAGNLLLGTAMGAILSFDGTERAVPYETPVVPVRKALLWALPTFVYVTALTHVSTLEDEPGKRARLFRGLLFMVVGAFLPLALFGGKHPEAALPALLLCAWLCRRAIGARDKKGVMLLVRDGVAGIILLDATLVMAGGFPAFGAALALLLLPAFVSLTVMKRLA